VLCLERGPGEDWIEFGECRQCDEQKDREEDEAKDLFQGALRTYDEKNTKIISDPLSKSRE
jgi:hypothetical protein